MNFNKNKNISKKFDILFTKFIEKKQIKRLIFKKKKSLGRSYGSIVCWHRGGGVKRNFRALFGYDKKLPKYGVVRDINYDPNRSAFIGLIQFNTGSFGYHILPSKVKIDTILSFNHESVINHTHIGDFIKLKMIPIGSNLYNLEKYPGSGPVYSKAAGVFSKLLSKDLVYAKIKLPSGEQRLFDLNCKTSLGIVSNSFNKLHKKYKAGTNRMLNKRPTVRGTAMNPIDHPHGGGAGKTAPGRPSVSPWGKLTKGVPTRKKNIKNKFIIKKR